MRAVMAAGMAILLVSCGSQPATPPAAAKVTEVTPAVESLAQPVYPESARKAGMEGTAVVAVTLSADGSVLGCSLATSSGFGLLDEAAIGAAQMSKYRPGMKEGKPAVTKIMVPFRFRLADKQSSRTGAQDVARWFEPAMEV